jgi:hypothetical protein
VLELVRAGDPGACRAVADAGRAVGKALAGICAVLDPRLVVVGGRMAAAGAPLLDGVREELLRWLPPSLGSGLAVLAGRLGARAEVLGAIAMAGREQPTPTFVGVDAPAVWLCASPGNLIGLNRPPRRSASGGDAVFEADDIRNWRGHDVVDAEGRKVGELEAIYVDTTTDQPSFGTVKVGLPTRHRLVFVPLDRAKVGPGYLAVAYDRKLIKDAPSIDTDGELPSADEEAVFTHYGLSYQPGAQGERQLARR